MTIKTLWVMLSILTAPLLMQAAYAAVPAAVQQQSRSQSVTLTIQNMTCPMCKFTIKKALQSVDGVQQAVVDADSKTAAVTFDPQKTNIAALIKATTNAGYPATARDGDRDCSRQSSAFPPSVEVRSVAIGREPMRPTVRLQ